VTIAGANGLTDDGVIVTCVSNASSIVSLMADPSAAWTVWCDGHSWTGTQCGLRSSPVVCVDCVVDPCTLVNQCTSQLLISPCQELNCPTSINSGRLRSLSIGFVNLNPAPRIQQITVDETNQRFLSVQLVLSKLGIVQCAAFPLDYARTMPTILDIQIQGNAPVLSSLVDGNTSIASVVITNLAPSTHYNV